MKYFYGMDKLLPLDPESIVDLVKNCDCWLEEDLLRLYETVWSASVHYRMKQTTQT